VPSLRWLTLALALIAVAPAPAAARGMEHRLPVDGVVLRGFEPPATTYGPGHRGVDLAAPRGAPVRASAAGDVRFAGPVAGTVWVTVDHGAGIVTSYGPLADAAVATGDRVGRGTPLGDVRGPPHGEGPSALHWSARRDGRYVDPLGLLDPGPTAWTVTLVGPGEWWTSDRPAGPTPYARWDGSHRLGLVPPSRIADGPGWATAPNPNHVVGIAGLTSATGEPPLDLTHLGYDAADVSQMSYADDAVYGPEDTWQTVDASARRLREHLRARWAAEPGRGVDLVGHSLGGVVAVHYLLAYHDPLDPTLPPIGHVATIASPLEGADLASAVLDVERTGRGRAATGAVAALLPGVPADRPVIDDLAVASPLVEQLAVRWRAAVDDPWASPLATGTRLLTLGAEVDLVVPEHRSDLPDAAHVVLPGGHDGVRRTEAARWVLRAFLSDAPLPGEAGGIGHRVSHVVGWSERAVAHALTP
jgi:hypothetical protein